MYIIYYVQVSNGTKVDPIRDITRESYFRILFFTRSIDVSPAVTHATLLLYNTHKRTCTYI